ncbi:MAG: lipoyl synthase [Candidatus Micrarchaeia archaeon]
MDGKGMRLSFITGQGRKLPDWFRIRHIDNPLSRQVGRLMDTHGLNSVCQSAHCPNRSECWAEGTASFMVMGEHCTRGCRFCAISTMARPPPLDPQEPKNLAEAINSLGLKYVVITSVARDDLEDDGAGHFAECIKAVRERCPGLVIEVLVPDFKGKIHAIRKIVDAKPDVVSHNVETVERLTRKIRDIRAAYRQSLEVLRLYRELSGGRIITKSGMMVGFGESEGEVRTTMEDLISVGVEILTIGQYLSPGSYPRHLPVAEFVHPDRFERYESMGYSLGFRYMACGPLVRSSYKAGEPFIKKLIESRVG